ncbi:MAG TPA: PAS domain S-box protein [candidate division Zixibacteria bacterium]|nr:PAS domain S-box protein [candidate division Zixibacteria bacterium]
MARKIKTIEKRNVDALSKSDALYKLLIENTSDYIAVIDLCGNYIYVSPSHGKLGYSEEDLIGKPGLDFVHPDDRKRLHLLLVEFASKITKAKITALLGIKKEVESMRLEFRFPDSSGKWHDIETTPNIVENPVGEGYAILLISRDITERTNAGKALEKSEKKYRGLFENANDAICVVDPDFKYVEVNKKAEKMFGYSRKELLNMSILDILPHDQIPRSKTELDKLKKKGSYEKFFGKIRTRDGSLKDVEVNSSALMDGGSIDIIRDITERKRMERSLRESEEKYRALMDDAGDAILLIDFEGTVRGVNKKAQEMFGYNQEEFLKMHVTRLYPQEELGRSISSFKETIRKGSGFLKDGLVKRQDGGTVPVDIAQSVIKYGEREAVQGIFRDITERKREDEALRLSEQKFRRLSQEFHAVLDAIPDNLTLQSPDQKVLWANKGAADGLGLEISDFIDKYCYELWHNRSVPCVSCPVQKSFQTGKASNDETTTPDGRIWELRAVPILDEDGNVTSVVELGRNITEAKHAIEVSIENVRLSHASKAKSDFLAAMSHELRTPLNSIIGFSDLLKQRIPGELNEKQEKFVDNVLTSGKHLLNIINDVLDLSKIESGKMELSMEKISLPALINESIVLIKETASRHYVTVKEELDPEIDLIECDMLRVKQVLFNLFSNAVKFSKSEGGTITVRTKKDGDMAVISVSDTGIGIKEEDIGNLFKKFEQLDSGFSRKYSGTGLGLAISKKLVELHGGRIWVESRYGEGSIFIFMLPIRAKK